MTTAGFMPRAAQLAATSRPMYPVNKTRRRQSNFPYANKKKLTASDDHGRLGVGHGVVEGEGIGVVADVVDAREVAAHGRRELERGASDRDDEFLVADGRGFVGGDRLGGRVPCDHAGAEVDLDAVGVVPLLVLSLAAASDGGVEAREARRAGLVEEGFGQRRALVRENFFRGTDEEVRASPGGDDGAGEVAGAVAAAHDDDLLGDLGGHRVWVGTSVCRDGMAKRRGLLSVLIEKGDVSEGFAR